MRSSVMYLPPPSYDFLLGLIDDTGIYEHSRFGVPRREHGYTVDDASRALIVLCHADTDDAIERAQSTMLAFLLDSFTPEGTFRNRLSFDRQWEGVGDPGDAQGRGTWALAVAATSASRADLGDAARSALGDLPAPTSPHLRPLAYAALGAHELWRSDPDDSQARRLATPALQALMTQRRPWPERRLTYANARIPAAMMAAGQVMEDSSLVEAGLETLGWLADVEMTDGHFSFTPVGGWSPGEPRPGFDQQPVEAAAMSDACERAWLITGEERWRQSVLACGAWLMGANDGDVELYDSTTGATRDGLTAVGVNANSGAESTISGVAILQACRRIGGRSSPMTSVGRETSY